MTQDLPAPDQAPGAPHPREAVQLFGQDSAEQAFLQAFVSGRLHHGWLLAGPRGVGKATLAWRIARFLLATPDAQEDGLFGAPPPPVSLDIDPDNPVAHRVMAGSDPGLVSITRSANDKTGKMRDQIVVEDVRKLGRFFGLSATDGGRRVVIVDAADEMNPSAANALLKMLEEPPARTTLLLISHQPSRLLPTIRSRCRTLRLTELSPHDLSRALEQAGAERPPDAATQEALATLARGSAGDALRLMSVGGLEIYAELIAILQSLPRLDRPRTLKLAESAAQRGGDDRFRLMLDLTDILLARLARTGASGQPPSPLAAPGEAELLARLSPNAAQARAWASLSAQISARTRHGLAVNLDPAALVLDMIVKIQDVAPRS